MPEDNSGQFDRILRKAVVIARRRFPPGVRTVVGLLLVIGGCFGFLPVLGFWMIPLGLVFIVIDIPPMRRRLMNWLRKRRHKRREKSKET